MKNKQRLQSIIFSIRRVYYLNILNLLILLAASSLLIFLSPRAVRAEAMLYIHGGLGDFEIKTNNHQDQSISKNDRKHIGLGMDLEREGYPLRVSFQWSFFETEEESEEGPEAEEEGEEEGEPEEGEGENAEEEGKTEAEGEEPGEQSEEEGESADEDEEESE